MSYDPALAERVRQQLYSHPGMTEKVMFGGIAFLLNGNMCCGVHGQDLIVRLAPELGDQVLSDPYVRPFDLSGRPMKGWLFIHPSGLTTEDDLTGWLNLAVAFTESLPPK